MKKTTSKLFVVPYMLWIALFVLAPLVLIFGQSFFNIEGQFSLENYKSYFASQNLTYLKMSFNSVLYAGIVTMVTLLISYPTALFLTRLKHRQLWLMLIILPTWINLLLKAYAFIGIFGQNGSINQFLEFIGIGSQQLLFTDFSFIFVASYIELPFMILPIFNVLDDMDNNLINRGDLTRRRRHRRDEYHARKRYRAHARDRHQDGDRREAIQHFAAVFDRGDLALLARWSFGNFNRFGAWICV